jgi:hypothetical protein
MLKQAMFGNDCALKILSRTGIGLVTRFIDHFTTRLGTTSNYSAIANLHTLQSLLQTLNFSSLQCVH